MPTGYTAKLMEDGQTFQEFVMGCARAFKALISMRDEPFDAPIPDKFEESTYHKDAAAEARIHLDSLEAMNQEEKEAYGKSQTGCGGNQTSCVFRKRYSREQTPL